MGTSEAVTVALERLQSYLVQPDAIRFARPLGLACSPIPRRMAVLTGAIASLSVHVTADVGVLGDRLMAGVMSTLVPSALPPLRYSSDIPFASSFRKVCCAWPWWLT